MPITDEEATTLRTLLAGNLDEFKQLQDQLDRDATKYTYAALILGGFITAVERRFSSRTPSSEIIEFVGDVRSRLDDPDELDPIIAERVIRSVFNDDNLDDVDGKIEAGHQFVLLAALVGDQQLDDAELDKFLADARRLGNDLLGE